MEAINEHEPLNALPPAYLAHHARVRKLVERLKYTKKEHNGFRVTNKGGLVFLQHWQVHNQKMEKGRKFYISEHMVDSEIIQTALLAVLTFEEHEARENFLFDGRRPYGPHRSLVNLDKECELRSNVNG